MVIRGSRTLTIPTAPRPLQAYTVHMISSTEVYDFHGGWGTLIHAVQPSLPEKVQKRPHRTAIAKMLFVCYDTHFLHPPCGPTPIPRGLTQFEYGSCHFWMSWDASEDDAFTSRTYGLPRQCRYGMGELCIELNLHCVWALGIRFRVRKPHARTRAQEGNMCVIGFYMTASNCG